jgi:hypothetical protein
MLTGMFCRAGSQPAQGSHVCSQIWLHDTSLRRLISGLPDGELLAGHTLHIRSTEYGFSPIRPSFLPPRHITSPVALVFWKTEEYISDPDRLDILLKAKQENTKEARFKLLKPHNH